MKYRNNELDKALDEMVKQQCQEYTEQELNDMYQEHLHKINISNSMKLYGAI